MISIKKIIESLCLSGYIDEIARLNNRIEGMAKDNLNLLNSKLMLRKQNRIYKKEIERLKKELSLVI